MAEEKNGEAYFIIQYQLSITNDSLMLYLQ